VTEERTQFRWLAPTTANLAQLTLPVPPGFREVSAQGQCGTPGGPWSAHALSTSC